MSNYQIQEIKQYRNVYEMQCDKQNRFANQPHQLFATVETVEMRKGFFKAIAVVLSTDGEKYCITVYEKGKAHAEMQALKCALQCMSLKKKHRSSLLSIYRNSMEPAVVAKFAALESVAIEGEDNLWATLLVGLAMKVMYPQD